jgi:hypothetical protein
MSRPDLGYIGASTEVPVSVSWLPRTAGRVRWPTGPGPSASRPPRTGHEDVELGSRRHEGPHRLSTRSRWPDRKVHVPTVLGPKDRVPEPGRTAGTARRDLWSGCLRFERHSSTTLLEVLGSRSVSWWMIRVGGARCFDHVIPIRRFCCCAMPSASGQRTCILRSFSISSLSWLPICRHGQTRHDDSRARLGFREDGPIAVSDVADEAPTRKSFPDPS